MDSNAVDSGSCELKESNVSPPVSCAGSQEGGSLLKYHDVTAAAYRIKKGVKETSLEACGSYDLFDILQCG